MNLRTILPVVFGVLLSCKSDSTEPKVVVPESFSLRMTVRNTVSAPVAGLRISASNDLSVFQKPAQIGAPLSTTRHQAVSTIRFNAPIRALVRLSVFDMDDQLVTVLFQSDSIPPGLYAADFSIQVRTPTRVYKCVMISRNMTTGSVLFHDSVYAVLSQPDAEVCVLGVTSATGSFETTDTLLFPNLLNLPPLISTSSAGPTPLGTFAILDSVTFTLTDTIASRSQTFRRSIKSATNDFSLMWNPSILSDSGRTADNSAGSSSIRIHRISGNASDWSLEQNFPNPFN